MTTLNTPEGIRHFQLCQIKARLSMEARGLKSRGPSALTQAKQHFGCKGNRAKVQEQIQAMIDNSLAAKDYAGRGLYNCCYQHEAPNWSDFDGFEVQAVQELVAPYDYGQPGDGGACEPIFGDNDIHLATFWTVYGHLHDGGVEALTDVNTEKQADAIADMWQRDHGAEMLAASQLRAANPAIVH